MGCLLVARLRLRPALGREMARLERTLLVAAFLAATVPAAPLLALRLDFLAVPTMQLGFKHRYIFKTYRGRRREAGVPSAADKTVDREGAEIIRPSPSPRLRCPGAPKTRATTLMEGEARTPVSPTPSVVDRDRRRRNAAAMRNPLIDSRRPV